MQNTQADNATGDPHPESILNSNEPHCASSAMHDQCQTTKSPQPPPTAVVCNNCVFGQGDSCGVDNMSYIQPPRVQSFKPLTVYRPPTEPMDGETIYRTSFYPIDGCAMQQARLQPIRGTDNIEKSRTKMDDKTVTALSYMGHCGAKRPAPIIPMSRSLLGQGDMAVETTHQHDFVPKATGRCAPILPHDSILKNREPLENNTTFRLSFMPIDVSQNQPPKPIKPVDEYQKSKYPIETSTVYQLSYAPVCPPAKETYPWARKVSHSNPNASFEKDTVYKLSYVGNCMLKRSQPHYPVSCLKLFDGDSSHCTVYRSSYMPTTGERPKAFRPEPSLQRVTGSSEKDTIYKLSYMGHCGTSRSCPIIPAPSRLANDGPMLTETTHKHDFVQPPGGCRPPPFIPVNNNFVSRDSLEKETVYKLSYLPVCNFERAKAFRPVGETYKSTAAMEHDTVHRLSYLPVCPAKREPTPWAMRGSYKPPTGPLECATVMRMSYRPPGCFVERPSNCSCQASQQMKFSQQTLPKSGVVN